MTVGLLILIDLVISILLSIIITPKLDYRFIDNEDFFWTFILTFLICITIESILYNISLLYGTDIIHGIILALSTKIF